MEKSKEKTKIGMVGGGMRSFMGGVHRAAIEKAGSFSLSCGVFGTSKQASYDFIKPYGLALEDVSGTYRELIRREAKKSPAERVRFLSAVLPNTMHYPVAMLAMDCGIPVLGEKPFTMNLDEAANLVRKQRATKVPYRIAMVYPAYSQLVKARKHVQQGELGTLRRFVCTYQSGWMAKRVENNGNRHALWRTDARYNGLGGVVDDCVGNCQFVLEWLTGLEISEVCAGAYACVPGRVIPDEATVLVRTRQKVSGAFLLSQVATGRREGLTVEISGDKATLFWKQSEPSKIRLYFADGKEQVLEDKSAPGFDAGRPMEEPFGCNPAYVEALARVYKDFADEVSGVRKKSRAKDDRILGMSVEEGLRGVAVAAAIVKSFTPVPLGAPLVPKWVPVVIPPLEFSAMRK